MSSTLLVDMVSACSINIQCIICVITCQLPLVRIELWESIPNRLLSKAVKANNSPIANTPSVGTTSMREGVSAHPSKCILVTKPPENWKRPWTAEWWMGFAKSQVYMVTNRVAERFYAWNCQSQNAQCSKLNFMNPLFKYECYLDRTKCILVEKTPENWKRPLIAEWWKRFTKS